MMRIDYSRDASHLEVILKWIMCLDKVLRTVGQCNATDYRHVYQFEGK